jgi:hypothetical protein
MLLQLRDRGTLTRDPPGFGRLPSLPMTQSSSLPGGPSSSLT